MKKYILSLDQGTTSSRAILFDKKARIIGVAQKEFTQLYPHPSWVEHDANQILNDIIEVARDVVIKTGISAEDIEAIGITNQRETTVIWDKATGIPIYNAIVWQDKRTQDYCEELVAKGLQEYVRINTGLVIDTYFSATKIKWILEHVSGAKEKAEKGELLFGTIDTWLIWNLTARKKHVTDYSNASRTMLFNIKSLCWDKTLLAAFSITEKLLPNLCDTSGFIANTYQSFLNVEIPICGVAGDQQAALFGQKCFSSGMTKNTYGTGCFMLMNTGEKQIYSKHGLITTIASVINNKVEYALEGSVFIAGAAVQWLRDGLHLITTASETEPLALQIDSNDGVYMVPAFNGLGAPYWNNNAKAAILGLTRGANQHHFVRAALEAIAYQTCDIIECMMADSGIKMKELKVDGGAVSNNFLMQFQADMLNTKLVIPENTESTALGAAFLAGLASGFWKKSELDKFNNSKSVFVPNMDESLRIALYNGWKKAVNVVMSY